MKNKVICIGLGRTGTTTFGKCMLELGYKHLGREGSDNGYRRQLDLLSIMDFEAFFRHMEPYDSFDDYPFPYLYKILANRIPGAKFILTTRSTADVWADSVISEFNRKKNNAADNIWFNGELNLPDRKKRIIARYHKHITDVREFFKDSNRLLEICWEDGDDWGKICAFLGEPRPSIPFFHANKRPPKSLDSTANLANQLFQANQYDKLINLLKDENNGLLNRKIAQKIGEVAQKNGYFLEKYERHQQAAKKEHHSSDLQNLAICAIFKNEAEFLDEWIKFHLGVGVGHFFLYNDNSTDDYLAVLSYWIKKGCVTLIEWPENKTLVDAFNHCLTNNRSSTRWIAFLDLDEFLFSPTGAPLPVILERYSEAASVFVYWQLFGSSNQQEHPLGGSVIETYRRRQDVESAIPDTFDHGTPGTPDHVTAWTRDGKSIVQTQKVDRMHNHKPASVLSGEVVDELFQRIPDRAAVRRLSSDPIPCATLRINHYWSKSISHLQRRALRGSAYDRSRPKRNLKRLLERDAQLNEIEDTTILPLWEKFKLMNSK